MLRIPNVLLLGGAEAETATVREALLQAASCIPVRTLTELKERVERSPYDAVFCGWSFHKTRWKDTLEVIRIILGDLPVIFLSRPEDREEWKAVLQAGGFDLLLPPFIQSQTLAVLGHAVESYEARGRHVSDLRRETKAN